MFGIILWAIVGLYVVIHGAIGAPIHVIEYSACWIALMTVLISKYKERKR